MFSYTLNNCVKGNLSIYIAKITIPEFSKYQKENWFTSHYTV